MKVCNVCNIEKPVCEFYKRSDTGKPRHECKNCNIHKYRSTHILKHAFRNEMAHYVRGDPPEEDETSIYFLRNSLNGQIFYVGQSKRPQGRVREHRADFGNDVYLSILRNVPHDQATYWECKTIVDLIDAGCQLINKMSEGRKKKIED